MFRTCNHIGHWTPHAGAPTSLFESVANNMPSGTQVTLSPSAANEVDVWNSADPGTDDTPLLGPDSFYTTKVGNHSH